MRRARRRWRSGEPVNPEAVEVCPRLPQMWRRFSGVTWIISLSRNSRTARLIVRMDSLSFTARLRRLIAQLACPQLREISI